jgi:hypothetical protein
MLAYIYILAPCNKAMLRRLLNYSQNAFYKGTIYLKAIKAFPPLAIHSITQRSKIEALTLQVLICDKLKIYKVLKISSGAVTLSIK